MTSLIRQAGKQLVRRVVSPLADRAGLFDARIDCLLAPANRLLILMYHRVITDPAADPFSLGMCVQQKHFAQQMAWLASHAHVLSLRDAVERMLDNAPLPSRSVAITFDDGYADNLTVAAPILRQYGLPATFYVVTGGLEEGTPLWWDQVIGMVATTGVTHLPTAELGLSGLPAHLPLHPASRRRDSCVRLLDAIWDRNAADIVAILGQLERLLKPRPQPVLAAPRLSIAQLQQLAGQDFEIGGHTHSHVDPRLLDRTRLAHELSHSRQRLQQLCQQPIDSFAYPGGRSSVWMPDLLAQAGFHHAVDTRRGINQLPINRYALVRVGMPDTPVSDFKRAIRNLDIISSAS